MPCESAPCSDPEAVRLHLKRLTASRDFASAPRLAAFLTFVVENALAGNAEQIKESLIAVEVYGRPADYNPQIDSTVRVEAGRLRQRLRRYYDALESPEGIEIELPKGGYVPAFRFSTPIAESIVADPPPPHIPPRQFPVRARAALLTAICMAGTLATMLVRSGELARPARIDSVAVLPFVNLTGDAATARFCDGLTEELTTGLGRGAQIRVAARTTMSRYRNGTADVTRIGTEHGVRAVVEGSVRRDGERLIVTTQLIDTRDGYHLWADRYEPSDGNVTAQATIAGKVASQILGFARRDASHKDNEEQVSAAGLELYHRGNELLRIPVMKDGPPEKVPDSVREAVRLLREVTDRNPRFAKGWAALAEAAEWEYEVGGNQPAKRLEEANSAALRAVEIEPGLVEGWNALTSIRLFRQWDFEGALAASRRAIELQPRNVASRQRYIHALRVLGRRAEAKAEFQRAISLQPAAAALRVRYAAALWEDGEYDAALAEARTAAGLTNQMPAYSLTFWVRGLVHEQQGRFREAERMFREGIGHQPHDPWSEPALGHLLARTNRRSEAEAILVELRSQRARGRMTHVAQAIVLTALGRTGDAMSAIERGWAERDDAVLQIALDPRFAPLRAEPRFQAVIARLSPAT